MRFDDKGLLAVIAIGALAGCVAREEIIATTPPDGGAGGEGASGAGPVVTLGDPVEHPLGCGAAEELAVGDLAGDGTMDLFVGGGCLAVLRGDGAGGLRSPEHVVTTGFGRAMALGHIDPDHPGQSNDPMGVVGFSQPIAIYLGDGSGGFMSHISVDAGVPGAPGTIQLTDVAGDAALELVTSRESTLSLWLGDGTHGFTGATDIAFGAPIVSHAHGDFDADGHIDPIVATGSGVVWVPNSGNMSFGTQRSVAGTERVRSLAVTDLDGDGCSDVGAIEGDPDQPASSDGRVLVLMNDCSGELTAQVIADAGGAVAVTATDLDGDGAVDLVIARIGTAPAILTLAGRGDGTFHEATEHALATQPGRLAIMALEDDGHPDVITIRRGTDTIMTLRNTP